ncbi:MAG TPA: GNAT family N-acetyltransferase [Candidatus Binataceae bacterium]|nr:GNAT family N-acetyltransferase [Candidatus Binataceae bacterium]
MWRIATVADDDAVVSMCMALNADDPGPVPVKPEQVLRTLAKLREERARGCAVVCEADGLVVGYALLISFWSNEMGGEVCNIDELYVDKRYRGRGLATELVEGLARGEESLWRGHLVALVLEVSPQNERARALYERLGFHGSNLAMSRRLPR